MQRVDSQPEGIRRRLAQLYERSGIDYRYSCVEDYLREPADWTFFPPNWSLQPEPTTGARNRKYREAAVPLAEAVAREALGRAGLAPEEVTHVVAVSCTGFFAPGLDIELVRRLGMRPETRRVMVGFMGCYAAFNALRVAHGFCQSDPAARVLVVCVELCTLHFQVSQTLESAVVNSLFSDGAAAAVLAARPDPGDRLVYAGDLCRLDDDSMDHMTWEVGDTGFRMGLSPRVPEVLARHLPGFVTDLLAPHGLTAADVDFWAIHPGGRAIVERAQAVLGLPDEAVHDSLEVLRLHGNMSSPTILFVLKRLLDRHAAARARGEAGYRTGVAMAFGPGLTLEGCLWRSAAG
ncbi:MAG: chalcone synthase [Rhodothermaceae bacterium]|nr:MAG: chalcone synthase [Rhodothermaceae bacterium]